MANAAGLPLQGVELSVSSSLKLNEPHVCEFDLPAHGTCDIDHSFVAQRFGEHDIKVQILLSDSSAWIGRIRLTVTNTDSGTQVINYTDARQFEGKFIVGTEGGQVTFSGSKSVPDQEIVGFVDILLRLATVFSKPKQPFGTIPRNRFLSDRLTLRFRDGDSMRNVCLVAGTTVTLGRNRKKNPNDIALRVLPESEENRIRSLRISGNHAEMKFNENGIVWKNLQCGSGTEINGKRLGADAVLQLGRKVSVNPAGVLPLHCRQIQLDPLSDRAPYSSFERKYFQTVANDPIGPCHSFIIDREDGLSESEQYIVFQQAISLGSDPNQSVLLVNSDSVAMLHGLILWLAGSFWLEPLQSVRPTKTNGQLVDMDFLIPLAPNQLILLGDIEILIQRFHQL